MVQLRNRDPMQAAPSQPHQHLPSPSSISPSPPHLLHRTSAGGLPLYEPQGFSCHFCLFRGQIEDDCLTNRSVLCESVDPAVQPSRVFVPTHNLPMQLETVNWADTLSNVNKHCVSSTFVSLVSEPSATQQNSKRRDYNLMNVSV